MTTPPPTMAPSESSPAMPLLTRYLRGAALAGLIGASLGLMVGFGLHQEELDAFVHKNLIAAADRRMGLALVVMGVVLGLGAFHALFSKKGMDVADRALRILAPLAAIGPVPLLADYRLWIDNELTLLVLVLLVAMGLRVALEGALTEAGFGHSSLWKSLRITYPKVSRWLPIGGALALAGVYGIYFSVLTTRMHYNFCTSAFDLGIEHNLIWNAAHGEQLFRSTPLGGSMLHGGFHQTYFAYVIAQIYRFVPRAETLLVFQSVLLGAAIVPLFLFARRRLGDLGALILVALYPLYAPLHGANLYDFHYQPLGIFFLLLMAYLVDTGRRWWLIPVVLTTLSIREDMGAMTAAVGAFFALTGVRPKMGLALVLVGTAYFVALKMFIMPRFFLDGESSFAFMYKRLLPAGESHFGGVLKTLIGNPAYTLSTILEEKKLLYLLQIAVPFCLFPFRRTAALVLFGPAAIFTLLSTDYPALIMTTFQYTSYWTPMLFLASVWGLENLRNGRHLATGLSPSLGRIKAAAWLGAMVFAMIFTSVRFGVVFQKETARGAFDAVRLVVTPEDVKNHEDFQALAQKMPKDAKVAAAEWLISHVANRRDAYAIRNGILDAEYILFWLHPTKLRHDERPVLRKALSTTGEFGVVHRRGMFVLAKRGHSKELNQGILSRL